jgi:hypothetical protein
MKTAEEILSLDDRPIFDVPVPQWGIVAKVRELDVATMAAISGMCDDGEGKRDRAEFAARVIIAGCISPEFEPQHLEPLKKKANSATAVLLNAIITGKKSEDLKSLPILNNA